MFATYFTNWSIYARGYSPSQLPADHLTDIYYAFAKTDPSTGTVSLSDPWADIQKPMELGGKGCLGELYILKKKHRRFKVSLSIGGWTYSSDLTAAFADPAKVREFARSAVELVETYSLDGLDIDWEFPATPEQAQQYVNVLHQVRLELNCLSLKLDLPRTWFALTVAAPAGQAQRDVLDVRGMDQYLNRWNIMAYDYSGSWSQTVDHQANLHGGELSGHDAIQAYISKGVHPLKLVLGMPLYGRSFEHTKGIGHSFKGVHKGKYEDGFHDTKELPLDGAKEQIDPQRVAAYTLHNELFVTYDNADTVRMKADYIKAQNLAGGMFWEASGDRAGKDSLIVAFADHLGYKAPIKQNWLKYEEAPW